MASWLPESSMDMMFEFTPGLHCAMAFGLPCAPPAPEDLYLATVRAAATDSSSAPCLTLTRASALDDVCQQPRPVCELRPCPVQLRRRVHGRGASASRTSRDLQVASY